MKSQLDIINEQQLKRIISVAYGDANIIDKIKIYFLAAGNNEIKRLLDEYKTTAGAVRNLEKENCPEEIIDKIKIDAGIKEKNLFSVVTEFIQVIMYKPVLTAVTVLIFAAGIFMFALINKTNRNEYSERQIQLAEKQVKKSLVIVSKIFNNTADRLEYDIIKEQVAKPVNEGISTINELFRGG